KAEAAATAPTPAPEVPQAPTPQTVDAGAQPRAVEAISGQAERPVPVSEGGCLGPPAEGQAPSGSAAAEAGAEPRHPDSVPPAEGHSQPGPSMPQTAAADSRPRADEAILTPQAAAAVPGDLACGDDPEPDEPEDPTLLELYQQIAMMPQSAEDRAAAEL